MRCACCGDASLSRRIFGNAAGSGTQYMRASVRLRHGQGGLIAETKRSSHRRAACLVGVIAALNATQVLAQTVAPPLKSATSPTGVNLRTGAYSYNETDLVIGGGLPDGLTLTRTYNSGSNGNSTTFAGVWSWSANLDSYIATSKIPEPDPEATLIRTYRPRYMYSVVVLGRTYGFRNTTLPPFPQPTGGPVGTYVPYSDPGATLVFNGATTAGNYVLTEPDGTVVTFRPQASGRIDNIRRPDGTRLAWTYDVSGNLASVISNRGWGIVRQSTSTLCAVNLAQTFMGTSTACPAGAQSVSFTYGAGTYLPNAAVISGATKGGQTTSYQYTGADHLGCVKLPGQAACSITNTYVWCAEDPGNPIKKPDVHLSDPVIRQVDASGKAIDYSYAVTDTNYTNFCPGMPWESFPAYPADYRPFRTSVATVTETASGGGSSIKYSVTAWPDSDQMQVTDPLGRTFTIGINALFGAQSQINPEGDQSSSQFDAFGSVVGATVQAKPGSGLATIVSTAVFPANCTNRVLCLRPTSTADALRRQTDYTYDASHGGVLTITGPADEAGVRPVTRYSYVQRAAWLKTATGGYGKSPYPVWLRSQERRCRTTATVGNACTGGAADEVVTTYDYGPDGGPNNLQVRGVAVTANGTTLRTCYAYDINGRKISETSPAANLSTCS